MDELRRLRREQSSLIRIYSVLFAMLLVSGIGGIRPSAAQGGGTSRIKRGDVIGITVFEHEELTRTVQVDRDGTIDYPFLQDLPVEGMTLDQLRQVLTYRLSSYIELPMIIVGRAKSYTVDVTVLGQVLRPGRYSIPVESTIQAALVQAGGPAEGADLRGVQVVRGNKENRSILSVDLEAFLRDGDLDRLPKLEDDDVIVVTGLTREYRVRVLGSVKKPGWYTPRPGADLLDMVFMAGGGEGADLRRVRHIVSGSDRYTSREVDLNNYLETGRLDLIPKVHPGDIVIVPKVRPKLITWGRAMGALRDTYTVLTLYFLITRGEWGRLPWW